MVSIIIINYNTFQLTCNCLQSVIEKTINVNYEIILVDNNSRECSPKKFKEKFPEIILIENFENLGFSKGNNLGISYAKGDYILLLNSDTELQNNAIKIIYDKLQSDCKIGAASAKLEYPSGTIQCCCQRFPSAWLNLIELSRLHKLLPYKIKAKLFFGSYFKHDEYAEPDWIWGTFFMLRRNLIDLMNGHKLNDIFFMYMEDMQWCFDVKKLGYKIVYIPEAFVIHHCGGSNGKTKKLIKDNYNVFLKKNYTYIHRKFIQLVS